jgi:thiol-disulfide isomerase/thioredoxin
MQNTFTQVPVKTFSRYDSTGIRKFFDHRQKFILINFWFIGCHHCRRLFPALEKIREDYPAELLDMIAFSPFDTKLDIHQFKVMGGFNFDMQYDALHLNLFYQVHTYPCILLISADGETIYRYEGTKANPEEELRLVLDQSIKKLPMSD